MESPYSSSEVVGSPVSQIIMAEVRVTLSTVTLEIEERVEVEKDLLPETEMLPAVS